MQLDNLNTDFVGRNLFYHESIDSTQLEAWRLIESDVVPNGSLVIADIQTGGIGTHGRKWYTDENGNVAFSIVLYPNCNVDKLSNVTLDIAQIIVKAFDNLYGIRLNIKYPNDIVFNNKKLGGILTETKLCGENVKNLVIGIGINLNQKEFANDISEIATSIKNEFEIITNRNEIISEICNLLEDKIMKFKND